jgi:hypothetical protein
MAERLQPPGEHELRLLLLAGDQLDDVFVQARRNGIRFDVRHEPVTILLAHQGFERGIGLRIACHKFVITHA